MIERTVWADRRLVSRVLAVVLVLALPLSATEAAEEEAASRMKVTKPAGGSVRALDFLDAAGNVTKRIEARRELAQVDGEKHIDEVEIRTVPGHALVTESRRFEIDYQTRVRGETRKVWNVDNTITLYDGAGQVLFQKTGLECVPVALSASASRIACLHSAPHYWEGPPSVEDVDPQTDRLLVFSSRGKPVQTVEEPMHHIQNVKLSPSGIWLAYVNGVFGREEVKLLNLATERQVVVPIETEDRRLAGFREVLDDGELRTFEEIDVRQPNGSYILKRQPITLFRVNP